jgi:hypothetical protein
VCDATDAASTKTRHTIEIKQLFQLYAFFLSKWWKQADLFNHMPEKQGGGFCDKFAI